MSAPSPHALALRCPGCAAGYLLPRALLGSLGARITCPACGRVFDVDAEGRLDEAGAATPARVTPAPPARRDALAPGAEAASARERAWAAEVLDALEARHGGALRGAAAQGQLFSRHGGDLLEAFDEYRRRAGEHAGTRAFREALRERFQVELFPPAETLG